MHVRDKILFLIDSWHEAFGGPGGRYPQYYMAYEDLRRSGVNFPRRRPDAVPIITPPVTHPISRHPKPGYGMPSSSSTRLDEFIAADKSISLSSLNSMRDVLDLLTEMLEAVDPHDRSAVKDEVIIDLVEKCHTNQKKLVQFLATTGDEELLGQGLEINDKLQIVLAKHDGIASGTPILPEITNVSPRASEKPESSPKSPQASMPNNITSYDTTHSSPPDAGKGLIAEEDEEEDDFALLARRHSRTGNDVPQNVAMPKSDVAEDPLKPFMSNALVPIGALTTGPTRTQDQDIIELLSLTLTTSASTDQTSEAPSSAMHNTEQKAALSTGTYPGNPGLAYNNYVASWAQPQPRPNFQPQPLYSSQPPSQPQRNPQVNQPQLFQSQNHIQTLPELTQLTTYPPPPWAATPGYFSNQWPNNYSNHRPLSSPSLIPLSNDSIQQVSSGSGGSTTLHVGPKPFIPSYRLFEDLNVLGNADGRFRATSDASSGFSGSNNNHSIVGGRK